MVVEDSHFYISYVNELGHTVTSTHMWTLCANQSCHECLTTQFLGRAHVKQDAWDYTLEGAIPDSLVAVHQLQSSASVKNVAATVLVYGRDQGWPLLSEPKYTAAVLCDKGPMMVKCNTSLYKGAVFNIHLPTPMIFLKGNQNWMVNWLISWFFFLIEEHGRLF